MSQVLEQLTEQEPTNNRPETLPESPRGDRRQFLRLAVAATLGAGIATGVNRIIDKTTNKDSLDERIQEVIKKIAPNTCSIMGEPKMCPDCGQEHRSNGSGVVINTKQGQFILTCFHVVHKAGGESGDKDVIYNIDPYGKQPNFKASPCLLKDGKRAYSQIEDLDIALLRIPPNALDVPGVLIRKGDVKQAEQVVTIGSPLGMKDVVSTGIISHPSARPKGLMGKCKSFLTTTPLNPGNSGGIVAGLDGKLLGIAEFQADADNIAGAIRNDTILKQLKDWGLEAKD